MVYLFSKLKNHFVGASFRHFTTRSLKVFFVGFFLFLSHNSMAQDDWVELEGKENVLAFYKVVSCGDEQVVLLRFENHSGGLVNLNWELEVFGESVDGIKQEIIPGASIYLKANLGEEGDCQVGLPPLRAPLQMKMPEGIFPVVNLALEVIKI